MGAKAIDIDKMHADDLFKIAFDYAVSHPRFDNTYVVSLREKYDEQGELSARQDFALRNIIETWGMLDWAEETGLI